MTTPPIMPNSFAAYIHPLSAKRHYTEGSDGETGLSAAEAKKVKTEIALSKVLSKEQKAGANTLVDKAREMTVSALKDGKIDAKEKQALLNLAKHEMPPKLPAKGKAVSAIAIEGFSGFGKPPTKPNCEFFNIASGTSYSPKNTRMEGGKKDSLGRSLTPHTLENVLENTRKGKNGPDNYVAIAMDQSLFQGKNAPFKYGDIFRIPELEEIFNTPDLYFALVDNGGAFKGTGGAKVDICCNTTHNAKVQQSLSLYKVLHPDGKQMNIQDKPAKP